MPPPVSQPSASLSSSTTATVDPATTATAESHPQKNTFNVPSTQQTTMPLPLRSPSTVCASQHPTLQMQGLPKVLNTTSDPAQAVPAPGIAQPVPQSGAAPAPQPGTDHCYPHPINGVGGPTATAPFLQDFSLVAEAAKRAQMSIVMRDLESVTL
ncbi:hypothetical protein N7474_003632 [Penicillium riverlandense]|uniref:uncharacterized protein n=1 Tax=Penicillium riverlandense TaxID=1903569 RepID=UPI002548B0D2|nr:uncharacterized protein N7474_003632 [Penicillium riverlandense]KAJ5818041.1 hypothetical protein N7474_003632 [Penicillium riverlandense]